MDIDTININVDISSSNDPVEVTPTSTGPQGLSAYEVAVKNGFIGTEEEWLASLKGDRGDPGATGQTGATGQPGRDGAIQYTAGTNITIDENNVISATGGSGTPDNVTTRLNSNDELETIGIYTQQNTARKIWEGTLQQYNALQNKDSDTYYYITDDYSNNGLPLGGTTGQVLTKASNNDLDTEWVSQHNFTHETWTFTLDDDSTVDKEVVLW